ncbi:MAG: succinate dehydrogenase iron-sulfur subunit [Elusimicrobia bacterium]|jgi:succinate dehydrogenase / fumarate reductase iron-sulfur subunit|nr:succinate dehydrogenase iron-sulfur subunit [Elusimicrobiota bacterium]MBK7207048.1 succinate dehydrogenase iron-sulfur subunit [Elusimicrobiota bacterium]MBK7545868.1 succinate dehydrogenase iron-sulfur subunit [Elusimicrobiota bacterium]MBK7575132.1 succinate dehydrogenase iron-sulfur subunit [Elusimicrobiota bacterium]MBK7687604.1 succinate dehydrogenase iron-sulfur subunit [Elusimicrobiota bacterium]
MKITLRVTRFDPAKDTASRWEEFDVEVAPTDRVLDALNEAKWRCDGSLTYRRSCAHGICGSDALRINGRNRLACKVLVKDVVEGGRITIEPMKGFRVIKDLVVDMEPFFAKFKSLKPFLINDEPVSTEERRQSPEARARYDDTTKCILCGACTTSCPSYWADGNYLGPAAFVNAHRFVFDDRDRAGAERLALMDGPDGVWKCRTVFNCVEACPRDIDITGAIADVKRALLFRRE